MTNGKRATLQDTKNVTLCTEMETMGGQMETNKLFRCERHENRQNETTYVNLEGIGSIKPVRIFAEGNLGRNKEIIL